MRRQPQNEMLVLRRHRPKLLLAVPALPNSICDGVDPANRRLVVLLVVQQHR